MANCKTYMNKPGYTATQVAYGWAGAVPEKVTRAFGQEQWAQKAQKRKKVIVAKALDGQRYPCPAEVGCG